PWLEAYCLCLSGDEDWANTLPSDFPDGDAFIEELNQAKGFQTAGSFVATLQGLIADDPDVKANFPSLAKTAKQHLWLAHRKPLLLELARTSLQARLKSKGVAAVTNGKVENLDGGRVRLTYGFGEDAEMKDFRAVEGWWVEERASYDSQPEETLPPKISRGHWFLKGQHSLEHVLEFEGDMSLELTAQQDFDDNGGEFTLSTLIVAINATQPFHYARSNFNQLLAIDGPKDKPKIQISSKGDQPFRIDEPMHTKLWSAKKKALLAFNGAKPAEVDFQPTRPGRVLIWVHGVDAILIDEIVIEGTPTEASVATLGERWMSGMLDSLGLE
ncbi:MAG: hypothetical protein KDB61_11775, partial [Planctomycetes bacterium]|nr:hypothetical protein [Planctomycetota bacterium]